MTTLPTPAEHTLLEEMFSAAVAAARPGAAQIAAHLPPLPKGRIVVVGAGKGAAAMAGALEQVLAERAPNRGITGVVVTRYAHGYPTKAIKVIEAGHPNPDTASQQAAARILALAEGLGADDLLICLISGGGSALMALPASGLTLKDKQTVNRALLRCGATIEEINCVRKHLSAIKGGRLAAAAWPAPVLTLMVSDVPGDDPAVIASGPTVADPTTREQALAILDRYAVEAPAAVRAHLQSPASESPKPGDPRLSTNTGIMLATPQDALEAAAAIARSRGYTPVILGNALEGEARDVAQVHAGIARQIARYGQPVAAPCVLLSGGETTVTVRGHGRGGRNTEFLLSLGIALRGHPGIWALAADTDGIDGVEKNAGAIITPTTLERAAAMGLNPTARLDDNDSYSIFAALDNLVTTGPTLTNVNDFRAIVITPAAAPG
uniref:glycerate kinase type-2 family protein n=1 Tax=Novispirillum itersonii TaxID=189 RepID=UPI00036FA662